MQFEPSTFAAYDLPVPVGGEAPPSPYDATDAVYAAARMLCANGASGGANLSRVPRAVKIEAQRRAKASNASLGDITARALTEYLGRHFDWRPPETTAPLP
jgi:hypothetical protein